MLRDGGTDCCEGSGWPYVAVGAEWTEPQPPLVLLAQRSLQLRLFLSTELAGALALLIAMTVALAWANSSWSDAHEVLRQARWVVGIDRHWLTGTIVDAVNDGLSTLFFFVVGMEVRRELATSARRGIHQSLSVNERLIALLHPWSSLAVVPLFALGNVGVDLRSGVLLGSMTSRLTWAVVAARVVGRFVGIGAVALLGRRLRWGSLPQGVGRGHVLGGAALAGTGFTVALLVVSLSMDDRVLRNQATVGVLLAGLLSTLNGRVLFWGLPGSDEARRRSCRRSLAYRWRTGFATCPDTCR